MQGKMGAQHEGLLRVLEEIRDVAQQGLAAMGQDAEPEPEVEIEIRPPAAEPEDEEDEGMYT